MARTLIWLLNATCCQCFLFVCCCCSERHNKMCPEECDNAMEHWESLWNLCGIHIRLSSVLQKMSSIYFFITRHPLIILISLYVLYQLLPYEVEDDYDVLRVLVSALLLKSDDPHQKPQHFPELPEPPPPSVKGGKRTRVLLLAYARSNTFSFHFPIFLLIQIWFILCWRTAHSCPQLFLLLWTPVCPQTKVRSSNISWKLNLWDQNRASPSPRSFAAEPFLRNLSNPSLGLNLPQHIWTNCCLAMWA